MQSHGKVSVAVFINVAGVHYKRSVEGQFALEISPGCRDFCSESILTVTTAPSSRQAASRINRRIFGTMLMLFAGIGLWQRLVNGYARQLCCGLQVYRVR